MHRQLRFASTVLSIALFVALSTSASADVTITLKNSFIAQFADRATIDTRTFSVAAALKTPHAPKDDGDIHVSGLSPDVGLAMVVEILNANDGPQQPADGALRSAVGGAPIGVMGYWRLWPEHADSDPFIQGQAVTPQNTNPPHVFEIHPVIRVTTSSGVFDVSSSVQTITGYQPWPATTAFERYDNTDCTITPSADGMTTITTKVVPYNYTRFVMRLLEEPATAHPLPDGFTFYADVLEADSQELVAHKVRMVVASGTPEASLIKPRHAGDLLDVLGTPRIDLSLVRFRSLNPSAAQRPLPYEMIVDGIYNASVQPQ